MYINATINSQAFAACPKSTGSYTYCYADGPKGACVPADDPVTHNIASPPCKYLLPLPRDAINGVCGIIVKRREINTVGGIAQFTIMSSVFNVLEHKHGCRVLFNVCHVQCLRISITQVDASHPALMYIYCLIT